jgi:hypothetical protein
MVKSYQTPRRIDREVFRSRFAGSSEPAVLGEALERGTGGRVASEPAQELGLRGARAGREDVERLRVLPRFVREPVDAGGDRAMVAGTRTRRLSESEIVTDAPSRESAVAAMVTCAAVAVFAGFGFGFGSEFVFFVFIFFIPPPRRGIPRSRSRP